MIMLLYLPKTIITLKTLKKDPYIWRPISYSNKNLVECGLSHEMYGISILDNYLYQFKKCSVLIYRPLIDEYLDKNLTKLYFDRGYWWEFSELQPGISERICPMIEQSFIKPKYSLIRIKKIPQSDLNEHVRLNLITKSEENYFDYLAYDSSLNNEFIIHIKYYNPNTHYIMIYNGNEQLMLHNDYHNNDNNDESNGHQYQLIKDPSIYKIESKKQFIFICIKHLDESYENIYHINLQKYPCDNWRLTESLLSSVNFTFNIYNKSLLISKVIQKLYVTDEKLFENFHDTQEYRLEVRSLKEFFHCRSKDKSTTVKPKEKDKSSDTKALINNDKMLVKKTFWEKFKSTTTMVLLFLGLLIILSVIMIHYNLIPFELYKKIFLSSPISIRKRIETIRRQQSSSSSSPLPLPTSSLHKQSLLEFKSSIPTEKQQSSLLLKSSIPITYPSFKSKLTYPSIKSKLSLSSITAKSQSTFPTRFPSNSTLTTCISKSTLPTLLTPKSTITPLKTLSPLSLTSIISATTTPTTKTNEEKGKKQ